jgi:amidase
MARSVADLATLLNALVDAEPACIINGCTRVDYSAALRGATLADKRIGVLRFRKGSAPKVEPLYDRALQLLKAAGATLVEVSIAENAALGAAEMTVLNTEFVTDLNAYLATTAPGVKTRTLAQLVEFNRNEPREIALFGQEVLERAARPAGTDTAAYHKALLTSRRLAGAEGLGRVLRENDLDLLVSPTGSPAWRIDVVNGDSFGELFSSLPAVSGYPHLTVPMGTVNHLPVGLSFIGLPWSEAQLLAAAAVFEARSGPRPLPKFIPSVESVDPRLE